MKLWNPLRRNRHDSVTQSLDKAAEVNAEQATDSAEARAQLTAAVEAEQDQIRRNHLGHLLHDSLIIRRRHP